MQNTWMSLVPPLAVLIVGFTTHRVVLSLLCGVVSAAWIATDYSPCGTIDMTLSKLFTNSDLWRLTSWNTFWAGSNFFIITFFIILAILVTLICYSGGAFAYAHRAKRHIKDARAAETACGLLSMALFIDDYFSSLTVGSVMRSITDQYRIPRVKLAYLIDSFAAPIAIFCPFSSWVAGIIGFMTDNGISLSPELATQVVADPMGVYIRSLPFLFYSIISTIATWFVIRTRISFGPMHHHECIAQENGNLFGGKVPVTETMRTAPDHNVARAHVIDFLFPIAMLLITVSGGLLLSRKFHLLASSSNPWLAGMSNATPSAALFCGGILTLIVTTLFFIARGRIKPKEIAHLYFDGIAIMLPTALILLCAWTLGDILREELLTGLYFSKLISALSFPIALIPAVVFMLSFATAFAIGSSWGTMAIFFPIAIPMVISLTHVATPATLGAVGILFPVLGAVLSGAAAGDHASPLSDTTYMAVTGSGSYHMDHVHTQFGYAFISVLGTLSAFIVAGLLFKPFPHICSLIGILVGTTVSITLLKLRSRPRKHPHA